ncbi:EI24 domain-containing protein [Croceicoccus hydrothermalis]|uniref:EI24 domain-containing protein n=1 Tax=Croceicoccus hydrothermalis TaxID=2867964 RepID=UPI001EFB0A81|nr:EI24 domain-containing protein [Croceicoccus hydrothermalis]
MSIARSAPVSIPTAFALAFGQLTQRRVLLLLLKCIALALVLSVAVAAGFSAALLWGVAAVVGDAWVEGGAGTALRVVATVLGVWLAWRVVAMAVVQFYADDVVAAVEARHYPALRPREVPLREQAVQAGRGAMRALIANLVALPFALALLFTGVGTAIVFAVVNAWLLGRELRDMVWLRHAVDLTDAPLGPLSRFLLGFAVVGLLAVPFVNLLAPFVGAAAATHMVHRAAARH